MYTAPKVGKVAKAPAGEAVFVAPHTRRPASAWPAVCDEARTANVRACRLAEEVIAPALAAKGAPGGPQAAGAPLAVAAEPSDASKALYSRAESKVKNT